MRYPSFPELKIGSVIPGTKLVVARLLGRGGQGEVYLALNGYTKKEVAIKLLNRAMVSREAQQEFREECVKLASLEHENIVTVFDGGVTEENPPRPYFMMHYQKGSTLQQLVDSLRVRDANAIREEKAQKSGVAVVNHWVPLRTTFNIISQVCKPLAYVHDAGMLHRDLKGANIYLAQTSVSSAKVKLIDFGIAKYMDDLREARDHMVRGTFTHMAPETYSGIAYPQSDLYSLTVVLYELLTKRLPFWDAKDVKDLIAFHQFNRPDVPSRYVTGLSDRLVKFVMKNLAKDPKERTRSAVDYAREIAQLDAEAQEVEDAALSKKHDTDRMSFEELLGEAAEADEVSVMRATQASHWDSQSGAMVSLGEPTQDGPTEPNVPPAPSPPAGHVPTVPSPKAPTAKEPEPGVRIIYGKDVTDAERPVQTDRMSPQSHQTAAADQPVRRTVTVPMADRPGQAPARSYAIAGGPATPAATAFSKAPPKRLIRATVSRRVALAVVVGSTVILCAVMAVLFRAWATPRARASQPPSAASSLAAVPAETPTPAVSPSDSTIVATTDPPAPSAPALSASSMGARAMAPAIAHPSATGPNGPKKLGVAPPTGPKKIAPRGESPNVHF